MNQFLKKSSIILAFILAWGLIIVLIDPFNYFTYSIIKDDAKINAEQLNTLMYRTMDYMKDPSEHILIGDSRTNLLPKELINEITGKEWKTIITNSAKLNEIFDLFYMAHERRKLKSVVIGINFNMFNKYGYMDRVTGLNKMMKNPLMYIYNKDVAEASFHTLKFMVDGEIMDFKPPMTKDKFWKWTVKTKAMHWYGKYEFPDELYKELKAFDDFTRKNKIDATFIIVPHNQEFHDRLVEFELAEEEEQFQKVMEALHAKVYDFDFENEITKHHSNYIDPIHFEDTIARLIVTEVFNNQAKVGRKYD